MDIPSIGDTEQLIALFGEVTGQAAGRYRLAAQRAKEAGRSDLDHIFSRLAEDESAQLDEIRALAGSSVTRQPVPAAWIAAIEPLHPALDLAELIHVRPYGAWAEAVREKERTFRLLSFLAAHAETPQVRDLAESLATDQLRAAQRLRQARRDAYHKGRAEAAPWPNARDIETLGDLTAAADPAEVSFLEAIDQWPGPQSLKEELHRITLAALPDIGAPLIPTIGPEDMGSMEKTKTAQTRGRSILEAALDAFAFYDAVADQVQRPEVLEQAQALTAMALMRIKIICEADPPLAD